MHITTHGNGRFCWAELSTPDAAGAKAFYTDLLGWEATDNPAGPDMIYTMLSVHGQNAAALYQSQTPGELPRWTTYISVDDVDAAIARAKELGGTIIEGPLDVATHGRMAVVQDTADAVFCLWQPLQHIGYTVVNEPGAVCWNELYTRDVSAAGDFYRGLFGYGIKESAMPVPYFEFQQEGRTIAGMMEMGPEMERIPPHWNIYFTVANCDESYTKAIALGAKALISPMDVPGVGKMAMMIDPQGAVFAFID